MNAIILAGGRSRRMNGRRKAFLPLGEETFVERILRLLAPHFDNMFIVANEPDQYARLDARVVRDEKEGMGPLMGMYSGLKASASEASFVTAVDTPLVSVALVRLLMEIGDGCDARVPRWRGNLEPLCAVYSRRCLPAIERVLGTAAVGTADPTAGAADATGNTVAANTAAAPIVAFFPLVRACFVEESAVRALDPEGLSFFNVNTPQDYAALTALNAGVPPGRPPMAR